MSSRTVRVVHIITGLNDGGAERMLLRLLGRMPDRFESHVICMDKAGPVEEHLRELGIPVYILGIRSSAVAVPGALRRLTRLLRAISPDVVQTWMYHADLIGGIAARMCGVRAVVWNVRASNPRLLKKATTRFVVRLCAVMSRLVPRVVICCAGSGLRDHAGFGYQKSKFRVIPNGFDLDKFRPDPVARNEIRRALAVPDESLIIGYVARFDPLKNHRLFFEAAGILRRRRSDVRFVLAGDGMDPENAQLREWNREAGTSDVTTLIGKRDDIPRLNAAFDIATLCSTTEGFPNVLGEALACAVPCVSTDVGEAAVIVGKAGRVVQSGDAEALANAWEDLLEMMPVERARLGAEGRKQIGARFGLDVVVEQYAAVYAELSAVAPKNVAQES